MRAFSISFILSGIFSVSLCGASELGIPIGNTCIDALRATLQSPRIIERNPHIVESVYIPPRDFNNDEKIAKRIERELKNLWKNHRYKLADFDTGRVLHPFSKFANWRILFRNMLQSYEPDFNSAAAGVFPHFKDHSIEVYFTRLKLVLKRGHSPSIAARAVSYFDKATGELVIFGFFPDERNETSNAERP